MPLLYDFAPRSANASLLRHPGLSHLSQRNGLNSHRPRSRLRSPLPVQIAQATDPQERRHVGKLTPKLQNFIRKLRDELVDGHAIGCGNFRQDIPEHVLQPDRGDDTMDPQGPCPAFVKDRVGADVEFTHGGSFPADNNQASIFVPRTLRNWPIQAGCAGHAGAVTSLPSVTAPSIAIA